MTRRDSSLFSRDRSASERVRLGRLLAALLFAGALLPAAGPSSSAAARPSTEPAQASETAIEAQLGSLPLYFVANRGQADERVNFYVQGSETNVYFTNRGITYLLSDRDSDKRWAVKLDFVGANQVTPQGRGRTPATINYFKGPQEDWKTDIPTYSGLVYRDLWDGIDLVYSGTASSLKQSFVVHPGADPDDIHLAYRGATSVRKNRAGEITVSTPVGGFSDARPRSFQRVRGERATVESSYRIETARKETRTYGFQVGHYDRTRTLVIDPEVVVYAGYIGGSVQDQGFGIAVDGAGAAYVTGSTISSAATFPVTGGPDLSYNGGGDAFVAKVAPGGGSLAYAGYLGGSGADEGRGIAVDGAGAAYVTGRTDSTEATFPVTGGPDLSYNGNFDAFVAKVGLVQDLTVSKAGGGSGTVTSAPAGIDCGLDCTESYAHGTSVTLTATPAANSAFAGWSGGGCSGTGTCTVTMDAAKAVTATFEIAQRALTIAKAGGGSGTVTSSPGGIDCGLDCSESYAHGTSVILTATPAANSAFAGWSGGGCSGTGTCTVTMDAAKAVTATFEIAQRGLTVVKTGSGGGTVTSAPAGIDCGLDCSESYAHGILVTLTATPGEGSTSGSWKGCDEVSDDECTISLTSDATVTVHFEATRVVHERRVTLLLGGHLVARGRVRVLDGFAACAARVPVSIQRKTPKGWVPEARRVTRDDGRFRATLDDCSDAYRVRAPARKVDGGPDACKDTLSLSVRHKHDEQPKRVAPAT